MNHLSSHTDITAAEAVLGGGTAGMLSRMVIAPLDLVKIRIQLANTYTQPKIWSTVYNIAKNEGIRAFWKGNLPAEILYITFGSVQFASIRSFNIVLTKLSNGRLNESAQQFIAGGLAGAISTLVTYPFDFLRTRGAANRDPLGRGTFMQNVATVYKSSGLRGFYHGATAAIVPIFPNMGLFFASYSVFRSKMPSWAPQILSAASLAGAFSKAVIYPLDTIRKRVQVHGRSAVSHKSLAGYGVRYSHNFITCGKEIVIQEGVRGLYKGLTIAIVKALPSSFFTIYFYEMSITLLRKFKVTTPS